MLTLGQRSLESKKLELLGKFRPKSAIPGDLNCRLFSDELGPGTPVINLICLESMQKSLSRINLFNGTKK
jgi:hypothetical protein